MNKLLLKNNLQNWKKDVYHKDIYIKLTCKNNKCSVRNPIFYVHTEALEGLFYEEDKESVIDETYKERPEWAFLHRSNN